MVLARGRLEGPRPLARRDAGAQGAPRLDQRLVPGGEWTDMSDESGINWDDQSKVGARMVEQFERSLAALIAKYEHEGRYDDLIADFRTDAPRLR